MINRRISDLSSTEEEFNKAKGFYENALKRSGHNFKLTFEQPAETKHPTRNRKRKNTVVQPPIQQECTNEYRKEVLRINRQTLRNTQ